MKYFVLLPDDQNKILKFKSKARARGFTNATDYAVYFEIDDLSRIPSDFIVDQYNLRCSSAAVKIEKFPTRQEAMSWMRGALEDIAIPGEAPGPVLTPVKTIPGGNTTMATVTKTKSRAKKGAKKAPKKASANGASKGRRSQYAGLRITKIEKTNPRREGTSGHASFALVKSGMTYEQYIAAGGVRRDLEWDVAKGYTKLSKA
jgi:hypothetical protein